MAHVELVGIGPMLVLSAPRIFPVIEHLAPDDVAANAPGVLVFTSALEVLMAEHEVIEALHFVRQMVQASGRTLDAQEGVMVDVSLAAVAAVERGNDVTLVT